MAYFKFSQRTQICLSDITHNSTLKLLGPNYLISKSVRFEGLVGVCFVCFSVGLGFLFVFWFYLVFVCFCFFLAYTHHDYITETLRLL